MEDTQADIADVVQATAQAGSHATTPQAIASPAVHPTALPTVHPPIDMTNLAADIPPSSTPKAALMWSWQTALKPQLILKVTVYR